MFDITPIIDRLDRIEEKLNSAASPVVKIQGAATYLDCSPRTVSRLIDTKQLPSVKRPKLGTRIKKLDLAAFLEFGIPYLKLTRPQREIINAGY